MFNFALALAVGIITIITAVAVKANQDFRTSCHLYNGISKAIREDTAHFLDKLDSTRENRYKDRDRMLWQCDGFRHEWNAYQDEWADNFSMS